VEAQRDGTIPAGHRGPAGGFLRHRGLIAFAAGGAVAESCLLTALAPAARPLAPQVTALPPLAMFHDLRWLFGYNRSLGGFLLTYAALLLARAAVSTVMIRLAWPRHLPAPAWDGTFARRIVFTVVASALLSPVVTLLFGVSQRRPGVRRRAHRARQGGRRAVAVRRVRAQRLIGSVGSDGAAYAAAAVRNGQRIHWLAVVPLADAVTLPVCDLPSNVIVLPALHGSLLGNYAVDWMAHRFLSDEDVAGAQQLRDTAEVIAAAAAAWRMPVLGQPGPACTK
jgi:hypothetical protein